MKRYITPTIYAVEVQSESIATWGSIEFDRNGTNSFDDEQNSIQVGGESNYFDAPESRSSWDNYEK